MANKRSLNDIEEWVYNATGEDSWQMKILDAIDAVYDTYDWGECHMQMINELADDKHKLSGVMRILMEDLDNVLQKQGIEVDGDITPNMLAEICVALDNFFEVDVYEVLEDLLQGEDYELSLARVVDYFSLDYDMDDVLPHIHNVHENIITIMRNYAKGKGEVTYMAELYKPLRAFIKMYPDCLAGIYVNIATDMLDVNPENMIKADARTLQGKRPISYTVADAAKDFTSIFLLTGIPFEEAKEKAAASAFKFYEESGMADWANTVPRYIMSMTMEENND